MIGALGKQLINSVSKERIFIGWWIHWGSKRRDKNFWKKDL